MDSIPFTSSPLQVRKLSLAFMVKEDARTIEPEGLVRVGTMAKGKGMGGWGMSTMRPKGVLALGWACLSSAASGRTEHRPTSEDYPDSVVRRTTFTAGG